MSAWHWYTKARRIPTLIGKDAAGRRIPGGPYTALQAIAALLTPAVTWSTRALWDGQLTGLATIIAVLAMSFGVVKLLGKVDFASRNPLLLTNSFLRQMLTPSGGSLAGKALRPDKTRRIRSSVVVGRLTEPAPTLAAEASTVSAQVGRELVGTAVAAAALTAAQEAVPAPRRGSVSTGSTGGARGSAAGAADPADQRSSGPPVAASIGLQPRSTGSEPRRSGLEAFLSSTNTQEEAA